jgi:hypothetical protein
MSAIKDILAGLKTAIELNSRVVSVGVAVDRLATDMRDFDRRLVRVETIIEITKPDGGVLRITRRYNDRYVHEVTTRWTVGFLASIPPASMRIRRPAPR